MHGTMDETEVDSATARLWAERERWVPRGISTYTHIVADHAHGAQVWDVDGNSYLDFAGGIGVLNAGHTPAEVVHAIQEQATRMIHMCFSVAIYEPYIELARRLAQTVPGSFSKKTMLVNSGVEAVENAIKIARVATGRENIVAFSNAFHGRTLMGMSLTGKDRPYKFGFGPFAPGIYHAPFPYAYRYGADGSGSTEDGADACAVECTEVLERMLREDIPAGSVAAIIIEPVQGEGGFVVAPSIFLQSLRKICDREGILLIADEIQTGFGRTGRMFAMEHSGVDADIVCLAKSLGSGMPIGAVVGRAEVMDAPGPGGIGGTYGGNPVACVAALAILDLFEERDLVGRAEEIGKQVRARFESLHSRYPIVGDVRGLGAMMAMELVRDRETKEPATAETADIIHRCHDAGLIVIKAGLYDNVIRVLVPFVVTDAQLHAGLNLLEKELAATVVLAES